MNAAAAHRGPLDVFLVAGETSGDHLGASLMRKLRERSLGEVQFRGVGGTEMAGQGLASQFPMEDVTAMGFGAVVRKLPLILRRMRETTDAILQSPPDILVLIDSPDFNQRIAKRVRRAQPELPIVKYVSPTVWAWRPGRARKLKPLVDHLLALFPFEPEVHRKLGGPPTSYVGHPLLERLKDLRASETDMQARNSDPPLVVVLPGSRRMEISRLAPYFGKAVEILANSRPIEFVLPTLPSRLEEINAAIASWSVKPRIVTTEAEKYAAFRRARAALAASGTVTLELALAHVPMVAAYRVPHWEAMIVQIVTHVRSAILPNIVLDSDVVPQVLQGAVTGKNLAQQMMPLLSDSPQRKRQLDAFVRLDEIFHTGDEEPSAKAARIVLEVLEKKR